MLVVAARLHRLECGLVVVFWIAYLFLFSLGLAAGLDASVAGVADVGGAGDVASAGCVSVLVAITG